MKVGMISLGCSKNLVDTEMVLGLLEEGKYEIVADATEAEMIIINTCGFISSAKEEAIQTIFEMLAYKQIDPNKKIIVMGCLTQRYKKELEEEIKEVDRFISIDEYGRFGEILGELSAKKLNGGLDYFNRYLTTKPFTAYVKIGEGCNNRCSYCAIPLIRGSFKSRSLNEVLIETQMLVTKGTKEINFISQDTSRFGTDLTLDHSPLLVNLLKSASQLPNIELVRALYLYPDEVTDELIKTMTSDEKIAPYFDIPIQHASDKILKAMYRRGDKKLIRNLVNKIREAAPHAVIRTTIIVGFPGETNEDFDELISFIKEVKFDRLGAFAYSPEEDTPACEFEHQIDKDVKQARLDEVMNVQKKISYQLNHNRIGQIHKALVEGYDKNMKMYKARSYAFAPDDIDGYLFIDTDKNLKMGDTVNVKITNAYIHDLIGEIIN